MPKQSRTGPSIALGGYDASGLPPNPSDALQAGKAIPIVPAVSTTLTRPFSEVTKNPLKYCDGPGTDERFTNRSECSDKGSK